MFLTLMVIGLSGLLVMAVPAFSRHGAVGRGALHAGHVARLGPVRAAGVALKGAAVKAGGPSTALASRTAAEVPAGGAGLTRFVPSPRLVFSLLALFGAFANALVAAFGLTPLVAALVAAVPTIAVERFAVTPIWRLMVRYQGAPSSPLEALVLSEAKALTAFRNGRGIVSVLRDGRLVQFSARLVDEQLQLPVRVGDWLRIEDVDARRERLTVSMFEG